MEEAREASLETILALGRALAVMNRAAEPAQLTDALQAPLSCYWGEALPAISGYVETPSSAASEVAKTLQQIADFMPL
jgi:hypothetical protein